MKPLEIRSYMAASALFCAFSSHAFAQESLSIEAFLEQVKTSNGGVMGALETSQGGDERSKEGELQLAYTLYSNLQFTADQKYPTIPLYSYDEQNLGQYTLGISKQYSFGLNAKLHYDVLSTNYSNLQIPNIGAPATGTTTASFYNPLYQTAPTLELTQALWGNGFGKSTKANQELLEASALSSSYSARYQARASLVDAENTYWRLVLDRQTVTVEKLAVDRAQKLYDSMARRAHLRLADESDALQAQAALQLRHLELQAALDDERSASRSFNSARNIDSDQVTDALPTLQFDDVQSLKVPARANVRDDVKAAEQGQRATIANSIISVEKDAPTLNVFGTIALNGRGGDLGTASMGNSGPFSAGRPTETVGLQFSYPLDFNSTSGAKAGWAHEKAGAELNYQRKLFEQEQSWKDLNDKLAESKRRLLLNHSIEQVQEQKLNHERQRLSEGRTTTYQVLSFEQDFEQSQISRIRAESDVLSVLTQMKLFGEKL